MYSFAGLGVYIRDTMPNSDPGLSGWGYTDFHASVNFAFIEFYEVRLLGILGSSHPSIMCSPPLSGRNSYVQIKGSCRHLHKTLLGTGRWDRANFAFTEFYEGRY
jgi:hypothetical protein